MKLKSIKKGGKLKTIKIKTIFIIILALIAICNVGIKSQTMVHPIEQVDPNVSQFPIIRGSEDPGYTGDLNLNIPLLTVPGRGGLDFNIDLQYVSGNGVPASESSSWVGLGWNLSQYQITCNPTYGIQGSYTDRDSTRRINYINRVMHDQPDIFYLSCPGISTQFQKFDDGNWYPLKWSATKIIADNYEESNISAIYRNYKEYKRFIITDVNGTKYIFSLALRKNTSKRLINHTGTSYIPTAFYYVYKLTSILAANYVDGGGDPYSPEDGGTDKGNWIKFIYTSPENLTISQSGEQMEINYLDEIITPTHRAKFNLDNYLQNILIMGGNVNGSGYLKCLNNVQLYRRNNVTAQKTVNFYCSQRFNWIQTYESSYYIQNDANYKRYSLDSICTFGINGERAPSYKFTYNPNPPSDTVMYLPSGAFGVDGWGLLTMHKNDTYPDSTQTDWSYWLIKDIVYPTGAKVSFVFESDRYIPYLYSSRGNFQQNTAIFAGGVRLKSKTIFDPQKNQSFVENYQYGLSNIIVPQAGFISCEPTVIPSSVGSTFYNEVVQDYNTDVHYPDIQITRSDGSIIRRYYTSSFSDVKTSSSVSYYRYDYNDYNKNYSTITMINDPKTWGMSNYSDFNGFISWHEFGGLSGELYSSLLDKIRYEHKEFDDEPLRVTISGLDRAITFKLFDNSWKRGYITKEEIYSPGAINDVPFQPTETKTYYYSMIPKKTLQYKIYIAENNTYPVNFEEFYAYSTSGQVDLSSIVIKRKPDSGIKTISYQYDTTNCLVEKEIISSFSDSTKNKVTFTCYAYKNNLSMKYKNMLGQIYFKAAGTKSSVYSSSITGNQGILSLSGNTWSNQLSGDTAQWNVQKQFNWRDANGNGNFDLGEDLTVKEFTSYDYFANNKELKDNNGVYSSIRWGYNTAKPTASFVNGRYNETGVCDFEDGTVGEWNYWSQGGSISSLAHSGSKSWYFSSSDYGLITKRVASANLNTAGKYKFSGWVKTTSTNPNLLMHADNSANYYSSPVYAKGTGNWEYVEMIIDLSTISGYTNIDLYVRNGATAYCECYWDDLRFYPVNSICESYTFDNNSFLINSITDENNQAKRFNYDGLDRLINTYDDDKLIAEYSYNFSRSYNENYSIANPNKISSNLYQTDVSKISSYSFYDGIGRKIQTQIKNGSNYINSAIVYDGLNQAIKTWKPYQINSVGYDQNDSSSCASQYGVSLPFIETHYDGLGREDSVYYPGTSLQTRNRVVKYYTAMNGPEETRITDENGKTQVECLDYLGNKKSVTSAYGTSLAATTEFNSDILNRLIRVIDPLGKKTLMTYNTLGQMITKTSPDYDGTGSGNYNDTTQIDFEYVYDKAGKLRFWRDAAFKLGKAYGNGTYNWLYNKYDVLGRPIETGIANWQQTRSYIESQLYSSDSGYEIDQYNANFSSSPNAYTSTRTYPNSNKRQLVVNYYDNYNFDKSSDGAADVTVPDGLNFAQGRLTARYTNYAPNISEYYNIRELFFYDQDGNIGEYRIKFPSWYEKTMKYQYDLQGKVTKLSYQPGLEDQYFVWYNYDDLGRLSYVYSANTDSKPATAYAAYTYNAAGKVSRLLLGGNVQGIDYKYNLRDWLTQINSKELTSSSDPGGDGSNGVYSDVFGELIGYQNSGEIASSHPDFVAQKNGNISWLISSTKNNSFPSVTTGWVFKYDDLNRLQSGNFGYLNSSWITNSSKYKLYDVNYDLVGNITSLKRNNKNSGLMDNLTYTYNGDRLTQLTDAVSNTDSLDAESSSFTYDANGNLLTYSAKGITSTTYNHQNLPLNIQFGSSYVKFYYDASGNRVYKGTASGGEYYVRDPKGNTIAVYDNAGNILFFNLYGGTELLGKVAFRY